MELTVWTYEGPPHVGAMRIVNSMRDTHLLLHAPQGDTYANLLFTMIERGQRRPPVSYTTFQARDLGGDTANLVIESLRETCARFAPQALVVGESCTAELIQDQPGALALGLDLPTIVVPVEFSAYTRKENWGAAETFYRLARTMASGQEKPAPRTGRPRANLLGPTSLGFRCRDDVSEVTRMLGLLGVEINVIGPSGASPADLARLPAADFNCCLYPEVALSTCQWLERTFRQPYTRVVPIGVGACRDFMHEVAELAGVPVEPAMAQAEASLRAPWYSRSVDSTYLTAKRVFVFGDATHACAAARIVVDELGMNLVGLGTYSRELARDVRETAKRYGVEALITDDYLAVEAAVGEVQPELVLGTQMERHVAKRHGLPCAVISAPVHVQDFPARYAPQMGFEGANVIFDTWVHPLMMGLEEHLLGMFRDDFEFRDDAPSHLGHRTAPAAPVAQVAPIAAAQDCAWTQEAERELQKIPFFVRGKARRNTEKFARERALASITLETLYDAKAHFGR